MRIVLQIAFLPATLASAAPAALANQKYSTPEFGNGNGNNDGRMIGSNGPGGGAVTGFVFERPYGSDYIACAATETQKCLRCQYITAERARGGIDVKYSSYCACTEKFPPRALHQSAISLIAGYHSDCGPIHGLQESTCADVSHCVS